MSAHISGQPGTSSTMWMRYGGGGGRGGGGENWQEVKGEEVSVTYINERPGDQVVQRGLVRACAVCLLVLCVLLVVTIIVMALHYNSSSNQLQNSYNQLMVDRNQLHSNNQNLTLERNQLQTEVNHLKRETAVKSCPRGWKKFGCSCYYRSTDMKTWEGSRDECLKAGADLVIINSKEEQEFIRGLIHWSGAYYSWIGLKRAGGNWTWVDGTPLTTQYWESGQPDNNKDRNCAAYWHRLGWSNWLCSRIREYNWICEK